MRSSSNFFLALFATFLFLFNTSYGCDIPAGINVSSITQTSVTINWNPVSGATKYKLLYRIKGTSPWTTIITTSASKIIPGLPSSTFHQCKIKAICGFTPGLFSAITSFKTLAPVVLPMPDHVVIFILENHGYEQITGSPYAPYINALASDSMSALFTSSYGLTHPSQPNYLQLFSGSDQGVDDDSLPTGIPYTTANLGAELIDGGKTFITYSESLPYVGYNGVTSGNYARKHNPAANWMGTGTNQIPLTTNEPFTAFPVSDFDSLPTVCYVVPNQYHDMHNGTNPGKISIGDTWFHNKMNNYIQWAKTHNSLFILTFDEDDGNYANHITTIFTGPMVLHGSYSNHIDHYNLLRTIEDMYGLNHAGYAATATTITNCWSISPRLISNISVPGNKFDVTAFPNPASTILNVVADEKAIPGNYLVIFDFTGKEVLLKKNITKAEVLNISDFSTGIYFLQVISVNKIASLKFEKK